MIATNYQPPKTILPVDGRTSFGSGYARHVRIGKLRAFKDEQVAFDSGKWLQAAAARFAGERNEAAELYCESIGLDLMNAAGEGTGVAGGYFVPAPIASTIIDVKEKVGISRQVCQVLPTSGDTLTVPKVTGGLTVYAPGEGNAITDSDNTLGQVELVIKKRAVANYLSNELNDDALISMADFTFRQMAFALAQQEDRELINGTGAGAVYFGVNGLLNKIGSAGVHTNTADDRDVWGEFTLTDLMDVVAKLPERFHAFGPSWICSHAFYHAVMVRLALGAGGTTMAEVLAGNGNVRSFAGYPVFLTSQMPTATATSQKCCLFGAFDQAVILADRGGVRLQRSDDYKFLNDQITFRGVSRYDINVHEPGTASAAGAYVALATNS